MKILKFYGDWVFRFHDGGLSVFNLHENEAKCEKHNFKRGLTVTFEFECL